VEIWIPIQKYRHKEPITHHPSPITGVIAFFLLSSFFFLLLSSFLPPSALIFIGVHRQLDDLGFVTRIYWRRLMSPLPFFL